MAWSETGIEGPHRFLQRVWRVVQKHAGISTKRAGGFDGLSESGKALRRKAHQTIERVTSDVDERIHLNTAVAALMELANEIYRLEESVMNPGDEPALAEALDTLVHLLSPFAPHVSEQMWLDLGHARAIVDERWPAADAAALIETAVEVAVQVNGKIRGRVRVAAGASDDTHRETALNDPAVKPHVEGKSIVKSIIVPGRLVNLVVK